MFSCGLTTVAQAKGNMFVQVIMDLTNYTKIKNSKKKHIIKKEKMRTTDEENADFIDIFKPIVLIHFVHADDRIRTCAGTKPTGPKPVPFDLTPARPRIV